MYSARCWPGGCGIDVDWHWLCMDIYHGRRRGHGLSTNFMCPIIRSRSVNPDVFICYSCQPLIVWPKIPVEKKRNLQWTDLNLITLINFKDFYKKVFVWVKWIQVCIVAERTEFWNNTINQIVLVNFRWYGFCRENHLSVSPIYGNFSAT